MYFIGPIAIVLVAMAYVQACGRPNGIRGPHVKPGDNKITIIEVEWRFRKRSTEQGEGKVHHLLAEVSPCHFNVYDTDRDGVIIYDEMRLLFVDKGVATRLFRELDNISDDNVITLEEFNLMAPKLIYGCAPDEIPDEPSQDDKA